MKIKSVSIFIAVSVFFAVLIAVFAFVPTDVAGEAEAASTPPQIVLSRIPSEGEYVSSVTVTINWNGYKGYKYGIIYGESAEQKYDYKGPFELTYEGDVRIYAYYYNEADDIVSISAQVNCIDSTAPYFSGVVSFDVDFSEGKGVWIEVSARDNLSGIATVYVSSSDGGNDKILTLVDGANATYAADCSGYGDFIRITATDRAGNSSSTEYDLRQLDTDKIAQYMQIYDALDPVRFTTDGWIELQAAFEELERALEAGATNASDLAAAEQRVLLARGYGVKVITRYTDVSDSVPTGLSVQNVNQASTDALIGSELILTIGKITSASEETVRDNSRSAATMSGYQNPIVSAFNLSLISGTQNVNIGDPLVVTVNLPSSASVAKIYQYSSGALRQISSSVNAGRITFTVDQAGDFYLVGDDERAQPEEEKGVSIGGKFFPASLLWTAGGIVAGVAVAAGLIAVTALYLKNKRTK